MVQIPHGKSATHQLEEKYLFSFARVKEGKQEESVGELLAFPACTYRGGRSHPETSLLHCFLFKSDPSHHSIPTSSILSILPPWVSPPPTNKGTKDLGWFYVYNPPSLLGQGLSFTTLSLHSSPLTWHHRWAPKKARNLFLGQILKGKILTHLKNNGYQNWTNTICPWWQRYSVNVVLSVHRWQLTLIAKRFILQTRSWPLIRLRYA